MLIQTKNVAGVLATHAPFALLQELHHVTVADLRACKSDTEFPERVLEAEVAHQRSDNTGNRAARGTVRRDHVEQPITVVEVSFRVRHHEAVSVAIKRDAQIGPVRLDRLDNRPLGTEAVATLVGHVSRSLATEDSAAPVDAVVISDYENGVIHPEVIAACLPVATARGIAVVVDAHGGLDRFRGATVFTPNQPEAEAELGRTLTTDDDVASGARELLRRLDAAAIQAHLLRARLDMEAGKANAAVESLSRLLKRTNIVEALMLKADAYRVLRQPDAAVAIVRNLGGEPATPDEARGILGLRK